MLQFALPHYKFFDRHISEKESKTISSLLNLFRPIRTITLPCSPRPHFHISTAVPSPLCNPIESALSDAYGTKPVPLRPAVETDERTGKSAGSRDAISETGRGGSEPLTSLMGMVRDGGGGG